MKPQNYTKPFYMFFLMLPVGISGGFATVTLPFLLTQNGFSVSQTAGIIAFGLSANLWRFLWGPIVDVSLSLRKWYVISLLASTSALLLLCFTPFSTKGALLLSIVVFISQVAASCMILPINGFMAKSIAENKKGTASGWFQAGSLAGSGIGGGAGLWLATNYSLGFTGIVLGASSFFFALIVLLIEDIEHQKSQTIFNEIKEMGKDILQLLKVPMTLFAVILVTMPIGTGASSNLWSAIAADWQTSTATVVLVTGVLSGLISALGCLAGGFIADRWGVWFTYLGTGLLCALVTFLMAVLPMKPWVYIGGVLTYAFTMGMIYAAFTAVILFAIGKKHVATKYSLIASLGNLPVVLMTAFCGWCHDKFNSTMMLLFEAAIGIVFVFLFYYILKQMQFNKGIAVLNLDGNE